MTKSSERPTVGLAKSKSKAAVPGPAVKVPATIDEAALLGDLRTLVQSARQRIATAAYSTQTLLCWHMGRRLVSEHLLLRSFSSAEQQPRNFHTADDLGHRTNPDGDGVAQELRRGAAGGRPTGVC